jgi:hypothetical protein
MNEPFTLDLFLSYAAADRAWARGYLIPALGVPRERLITHDEFHLGAARVSEVERTTFIAPHSVASSHPSTPQQKTLLRSGRFWQSQ